MYTESGENGRLPEITSLYATKAATISAKDATMSAKDATMSAP